MAKKRVKVRASITTPIPSNDGSTNPSQEEIAVIIPTSVNVGGAEVASESKNVDGHASKEGTNEEIPVLVVKKGEVAIQEGGNNSTSNPLLEVLTVPSPIMVTGEGTEVALVIKDGDKQSSSGGTGEETAMLVMKSGDVSLEEEENEMAGVEEEFEVEGFLEPNAAEDKDDGQIEEDEGVDNLDEEDGNEEENEDFEEGNEDESEGEGEEEDSDEEEEEEEEEEQQEMETGEEKRGKEGGKVEENVERTLLVEKTDNKPEEEGKKKEENIEQALLEAKTDEKMEVNSLGVAKKSVRSRPKKVGTKVEDKPTSSKNMVVSTAENKRGASSKKDVAIVEEEKPIGKSKKMVGAKLNDKPEASSVKKAPKRVKSMGLIFMCNSKTKQDCYKYKLLGLPASKKDLVAKVYKGMRLFLFDIDLRLMYGIYKAAGPGGYNIQPKAFDSAFPSQVRFTVIEDCLPLAEEKFKSILKDNYYAKKKFDCQLNSEQVKNLCKLFNASGRISSKLKKPRNVVGTENYPVAGQARIERPRVDGERLGRGKIRRKRLDAESFDLRSRLGGERLVQGRIKRNRMGEESSIDRGRIRRQIQDEERSDRGRIRRPREDEERFDRGRIRRQRLDEESWDPRYHERPIVYERERYASPLPPPSRIYDSSSRTYDSYGRVAESAVYMRDPVVDPRERVPVVDPRERVPVLEHRSGLPAVDYRDRRVLDLDPRQREVGIHDPYASYREYNLPRLQSDTYLPLASSAPEYRRLEGVAGYGYGSSLRPLYRY